MKVITSSKQDTVRGEAYINLCYIKLNTNPLLCKLYAEKALSLFIPYGHTNGIASAYLKLAASQRLLGEGVKGLGSVKKALQLAEKNKNSRLLALCYHELALISLNQNDLTGALDYNTKALAIYKVNHITNEIPGSLNNIGILYAQMGKWDESIKYFREAIRLEEGKKDKKSLGNEINNVGVFFIFMKDLDSAEYYLKAGKKIREDADDKLGLCGSYNNLSLLELQKNNLPKAIEFADESYRRSKEIKSQKEQIEVLNTFYEIYSKKKDYKKALEYFTMQVDLKKKTETEANNRKLSEIQSGMEIEKKENEILEKDLQINQAGEEQKKTHKQILFLCLGLILLTVLTAYVIKTNKKVQKANSIISEQKSIIEEKHKDITDSIYYAQKIQQALILSEKQLAENILTDTFILYQPKDIVSGDFYWYSHKNNTHILAAADCTGHGIPGAFMSLIGITMLNQIVNERNILSPDEILNNLRTSIISALNQKNDEAHRRDGMDIGLVTIKENKLQYAGANNPCYIIREENIIELNPDKQPIGLYEKQENFTLKTLDLQKGDFIYLFTDGYVDQFGGDRGKKLKSVAFKQWLLEIRHKTCNEQKVILQEKFKQWQGSLPQTDDILVIGIKCS